MMLCRHWLLLRLVDRRRDRLVALMVWPLMLVRVLWMVFVLKLFWDRRWEMLRWLSSLTRTCNLSRVVLYARTNEVVCGSVGSAGCCDFG